MSANWTRRNIIRLKLTAAKRSTRQTMAPVITAFVMRPKQSGIVRSLSSRTYTDRPLLLPPTTLPAAIHVNDMLAQLVRYIGDVPPGRVVGGGGGGVGGGGDRPRSVSLDKLPRSATNVTTVQRRRSLQTAEVHRGGHDTIRQQSMMANGWTRNTCTNSIDKRPVNHLAT